MSHSVDLEGVGRGTVQLRRKVALERTRKPEQQRFALIFPVESGILGRRRSLLVSFCGAACDCLCSEGGAKLFFTLDRVNRLLYTHFFNAPNFIGSPTAEDHANTDQRLHPFSLPQNQHLTAGPWVELPLGLPLPP